MEKPRKELPMVAIWKVPLGTVLFWTNHRFLLEPSSIGMGATVLFSVWVDIFVSEFIETAHYAALSERRLSCKTPNITSNPASVSRPESGIGARAGETSLVRTR